MVDSVIRNGLNGVKDAEERIARAADEIGRAFAPVDPDTDAPASLPTSQDGGVAAIVDLKLSLIQHGASRAIIRTGDELAKSAIDLLA